MSDDFGQKLPSPKTKNSGQNLSDGVFYGFVKVGTS